MNACLRPALRNLTLAVLSALVLPIAHAAPVADDPGSQKKLMDAVEVTATGQTTALSSTKTQTPLIETPQSISVITSEEMDLRGVHTVAEALSYSAGVQAEASGIDSRVDEVSVRGFGAGGFSSNNNFVDGLRLPAGGQWTRTAFDPYALQQIDVLKGPSSVLYGQSAPGGLVNLVSKLPQAREFGEIMLQSAGYTDLDRWQHQLAGDFGGSANADGSVRYRMVGLYRDGETQIDRTSNSRLLLSPSVSWDVSDATSVTLLAQYQRDDGGSTYQFLPATGTLYSSNGRRIELDAYLGEPDWNRFDRDQSLVAAFIEHRFKDDLTLRTNLRYTRIDTLYQVTVLAGDTVTRCGTIPGCIPGQTINRRAVQGDGGSEGWTGDVQLEYALQWGAATHTLLVGSDYFHTDWEHYRDLVTASQVLPLLNIFDPEPRGSSTFADSLNPQVYTETLSRQSGLYVQDQIALGNWRFALGGRYDDARDEALNAITGITTITEADASTWRAGAVYLTDFGLAPYLSYSESFQPSTGSYFDGAPFDPTTGVQVEAGLRYQPSNSGMFVTLAGYEIKQQNITTPDPDPGHICGGGTCTVQTGEGTVRGVELEARATLTTGLAVIATTTFSDAEVSRTNLANQLGNVLPQVPDRMASLFLDYRFAAGALDGLDIGGGARYVGESFGDTANTLAIPSYTVFDLLARYELGALSADLDRWTVTMNARNLANRRYVATCGSVAACYYGSGRTVSLRVQYAW